MIRAAFGLTLMATLLGGCFQTLGELNRAPPLSPVGTGITPDNTVVGPMPVTPPTYVTRTSLWQDGAADLFKDARAARIGDLITVKISIKDQASFNNTMSANRDSTVEMNITETTNLSWAGMSKHLNTQSTGQLDPKFQSTSHSQGQGGVSRSESIDLRVGAVVTCVLPNGNLIVSGRQEVLVNFELRELIIAGIVQPGDIAADNSIAYDKIAEARISYGGRGRVMEVQQPGWGQQLYNKLSPF
jgi:flagellar L-ring protein precursor FlgH